MRDMRGKTISCSFMLFSAWPVGSKKDLVFQHAESE